VVPIGSFEGDVGLPSYTRRYLADRLDQPASCQPYVVASWHLSSDAADVVSVLRCGCDRSV